MITAENVRTVFDYNPLSGELRWRINVGSRARAGLIAGHIKKDCNVFYRQVFYGGKR